MNAPVVMWHVLVDSNGAVVGGGNGAGHASGGKMEADFIDSSSGDFEFGYEFVAT